MRKLVVWYVGFVLMIVLGSAVLRGQQTAPVLKPEVKIALLEARQKATDLALAEQTLINQYNDTEKNRATAAQAFQALVSSALKDSGIDDSKWVLTPDLTVMKKPEPAPKGEAK